MAAYGLMAVAVGNGHGRDRGALFCVAHATVHLILIWNIFCKRIQHGLGFITLTFFLSFFFTFGSFALA